MIQQLSFARYKEKEKDIITQKCLQYISNGFKEDGINVEISYVTLMSYYNVTLNIDDESLEKLKQ